MTDSSWTGTPVRPHPGSRDNGSAELPWGTRRERLPLAWPFAHAVEGFRAKALANPQFDPASVFVWGQMMAVGLVEMLKGIEAAFGAAGHDVAHAALRKIGDRIATEMLEGAQIPKDLERGELASLFASWINEVVYASIENPHVDGDRASFEIHYCPHEDVYGAFDCRVQRYFVEGMLDAARRYFGDAMFDVEFTTTIPSGSSTCHFDLWPAGKSAEPAAWNAYSEQLRKRALHIVDDEK